MTSRAYKLGQRVGESMRGSRLTIYEARVGDEPDDDFAAALRAGVESAWWRGVDVAVSAVCEGGRSEWRIEITPLRC